MSAEKVRKEIEVIKYKRDAIIQKINNLLTKANVLSVHSDASELAEFNVRFDKLYGQYEGFNRFQSEIVRMYVSLKETTQIESLLQLNEEIDNKYFKIVTIKEAVCPQEVAVTKTEPESVSIHAKLPKIVLPCFEGVLKDWPNFKDLFTSLVHENKSLPAIEKFHYLLTCTKGEPHSLVRSLPISAANYPVVFNQLLDRYDNKRLLATYYIDEIINLSNVTSESPKPLRNLLDLLTENMQALKSVEIPGELGDFIILQVALKKIDRHTRQLFERKFAGTEFPSLDDFLNFLKEHCKCLDVSQNQTPFRPSHNFKPADAGNFKSTLKKPVNKFLQPMQSKAFLTNIEQASCLYCSAKHLIYSCPEFLKLSVAERREFVRSKQACFNCLSLSHMLNKCNSVHKCRKCFKRHHTSLHDDSYSAKQSKTLDSQSTNGTNSPLESEPSKSNSESNTLKAHHSASHSNVTTLLGTALVKIQDSTSRFHTIRALIDPGSQGSFISDSCVTKLNLPRHKCYQPIVGLSETAVLGAKGYVSCVLKPQSENTSTLPTKAIILSKITSSMPTVKLSSTMKQHFNTLNLADPNFDIPAPVDFLLGADLFPYVFDGGRSDSPPGYPTPFHTIFGWVLIGPTDIPLLDQPALSANLTIHDHGTSLEASIKRFWEIEEIPSKRPMFSPEDELCENSFVSTHVRDQSGRYIVQLPFKNDPPNLGNSFNRAKQCLLSLENRLQKNSDLKAKYLDFLQEYEDLGHMSHLSSNSPNPTYFIPHHGIFKASDSTPKLRVVFNASAQTDSLRSLNDELLIGPKLQKDICQILSRFRLHPIVFCTDICKMYRQILIHPEHRQYQTILWRKSPEQPIDSYSLNTVTYGVASSPFLALRTLRQLVSDEGNKFPKAAQAVLNDMFVDDCITGAQTIEEAKILKTELISLMQSGGFELSKWSSNNPELDVSANHQELVFHSDKTENTSVKVLGLKWLSKSDVLSYNAPVNKSPPTKRGLLSYISKIFDPLGLATPTVFWAKRLMQELWALGLNWDDSLPENIYLQWNKFCEDLTALSGLSIPRFVATPQFLDAQIHGFCDASEVGYACCLYLRTQQTDSISVHLLIAKSKVAPLKRLTIPKLELCGAYLLCKLIRFYRETIQKTRFADIPFFAWTDSKVCLSWIHTSPHLLKTFVGNRVAEIQDTLDPSHWLYVPSGENPADCASRGIMPSQLINNLLWWRGPDFLSYPSTHWPTQGDLTAHAQDTSAELRNKVFFTTTVIKGSLLHDFIQRFSSFQHLQRCTAWIIRFINNCRNLSPKSTSDVLTTTELNFATLTLVKITQRYYFSEDIKSIEKGKLCSTGLQRLQPFIDQLGIIRVGGRIRHAGLNFDAKHPMLIPKQSHLADLIIDHYHKVYLHAGPRLIQSLIVRQFWIMSARQKIRHRLSKCLTCAKFKAKVYHPLMADLPKARIQPSRPFTHCGVDYGGPFLTKTDKLRKPQIVKSYICLFVCLATKAIHLELVSSLSSEAFLAALSRFFARRGLSSDIYSDQGTNFVGASREINDLYAFINRPDTKSSVLNDLAAKGVTWHFNPPATPHFGGIWEAGIKSTKFHLKHVIGDQKLTFEEFYTLLTSIEAILNSRPLCQLSTDPDECDTLTPGHFLIGDPIVSLPHPDLTIYPSNRLSRWQLVQQQAQHFWKRWSREYIHTMQQREKWASNIPNLKINDLVLIQDHNLPVMSWLTGRVKEIHPGSDGVVRVATLKTKQGLIKRPVVKLCPLPIN